MRKIRNSSGFTSLEGLLVLVIIAIIGFTGWYVYHARNNANNLYNSSASTQVAVKATVSCSFSLSLGQQTGTAGTFHQDLIFTNKASKACDLSGYPKVTLTDSNGKLIGKAAANDTSTAASAVSVAAKSAAHATLSLPDPGVATGCNATKSTYVYATLPGSTTVLKVAAVQQYCPGFMVGSVTSGE